MRDRSVRNAVSDHSLILQLPERVKLSLEALCGGKLSAALVAGLWLTLSRSALAHRGTEILVAVGSGGCRTDEAQSTLLLPMDGDHTGNVQFTAVVADAERIMKNEQMLSPRQATAVTPRRAGETCTRPVVRVTVLRSGRLAEEAPLPLRRTAAATTEKPTAAALSVQLVVTANGITGEFLCSGGAPFDGLNVAVQADRFQRIMTAAATTNSLRLSELPDLQPIEERRVERCSAGPTFADVRTVPDMFSRQVVENPQRRSLVAGAASMTYQDLDGAANALANQLHAHGVRRGEVVGVSSRSQQKMIVGLLGVMKAGAVYLPLDPDYPISRLAFMLRDCRSRLVATGPDVILPQLESDTKTVELARVGSARSLDWEPALSPSDVAYLIYTSGSTGQPKGVAVPHGKAVAFAAGLRARLGEEPHRGVGESTLLTTSLSFDGSMKSVMLMLSGTTLHLLERGALGDVEAVAAYLRECHVDSLSCTPTVLQSLIQHGAFRSTVERPVHILVGGEAMGSKLWSQVVALPGVSASNHYGPTECTVNASIAAVTGPRPTIGRPLDGVRLYVLDEHLRLAPAKVVGELYVGGEGVSYGYQHNPSLTAERFVPDPFGRPGDRLYRTGDLASCDTGGLVEFAGRQDRQVQIRGARVELGEVEAALCKTPAVGMAAVLAHPDRTGGNSLTAYVTPADGLSVPTVEDVRSTAMRFLPSYMVPTTVIVLQRMPLSQHGKLDRDSLPAPEGIPTASSGSAVSPRTPTEVALAGIWTSVLGISQVGVLDDFFDLGGHSLLAMQVLARVRDELGVQLKLRSLFENPTIESLAGQVHSTQPTPKLNIGRRRQPDPDSTAG